MDDIGWGLDAYGLEAWGSFEDDSGGGTDERFEPTKGVTLSPGIFAYETA